MSISVSETVRPWAADSERPVRTLMEEAARGDPTAWRDLVRRYGHCVISTARRHRLTPEEVADVAQTTWLRLVENIGAIREPASLPGWLSTTAAREALALRRRTSREVVLPIERVVDRAHDVDVSECVAARLRTEALWSAVIKLPERQRRLLVLLLMPDELSYEEIGQRLGMPVGSIGPIRGRAIRHLRRMLSAEVAVPA